MRKVIVKKRNLNMCNKNESVVWESVSLIWNTNCNCDLLTLTLPLKLHKYLINLFIYLYLISSSLFLFYAQRTSLGFFSHHSFDSSATISILHLNFAQFKFKFQSRSPFIFASTYSIHFIKKIGFCSNLLFTFILSFLAISFLLQSLIRIFFLIINLYHYLYINYLKYTSKM